MLLTNCRIRRLLWQKRPVERPREVAVRWKSASTETDDKDREHLSSWLPSGLTTISWPCLLSFVYFTNLQRVRRHNRSTAESMQVNVRFHAEHAPARLSSMNEPRYPSNGPNVAGEGTSEKSVAWAATSTGMHHPLNCCIHQRSV